MPLLIVLSLALLLVAIVAEAGARGRLSRNHLVGIRIPSTLRSDEGWLAGHRASTRPSWIGLAVSVVLTLVAGFSPESWQIPLAVLGALVFVATIVVSVALTSSAARAATPAGSH